MGPASSRVMALLAALQRGRVGWEICLCSGCRLEPKVWDGAERLADLNSEGETVIVVGGGQGGRGNSAFVTSTNQFPLLSEKGEAGVSRDAEAGVEAAGRCGVGWCAECR